MTDRLAAANSTLATLSSTAELRQRENFAVQHMLAAARFARACHRIEQEHAGKPLGSFFGEIRAFVSAGVLSVVASMEANLNELLADKPRFGSGLTERAFEEVWRDAERRSLLDKYQFVLVLLGHNEVPRGDALFQNADALVRMRNALVHFHPEWHDQKGKHQTVSERLGNRFQPSPFISGNAPMFPMKCMCHSCLDWAVTTGRDFMQEFSSRSGLPFKFNDPNQDYTTTG